MVAMKLVSPLGRLSLAMAVVLALPTAALATIFVSVDIQPPLANGGVTQTDWTPWNLATAQSNTFSQTFSGLPAVHVGMDGAFTVNLRAYHANGTSTSLGGSNSLTRRSNTEHPFQTPTYTGNQNPDMLRDGVNFNPFSAGGGNQGRSYLEVEFVGLLPNTNYDITVFSYQGGGGSQANWTVASPSPSVGFNTNPFPAHVNLSNSSGSGNIPTTNTGTGSSTTNNPSAGTTFVSVLTNASGNASLYAWGGNGLNGDNGNAEFGFNGFTIASVAAIPEASSLLMLTAVTRLGRAWRGRKTRAT